MLKTPITPALAVALCVRLSDMPEASNAAVRVAVWMLGVAQGTGGFPLSLSMRQIAKGFTEQGVSYKGTGSRLETIKASLEWLEENRFLEVTEGPYRGFGFNSKNYTIKVA